VQFSAEDFESVGTTHWDGVRNPEACKFMREQMKVGDLVLFYHSNCKIPGVVALAEVAKEGYPDHTAWNPKGRYYDPKSTKKSPKWYMVDVRFTRRLPHFVPLALLQHIGATVSVEAPNNSQIEDNDGEESSELMIPDYLTHEERRAIAGMQLLNRGRLSVQVVEQIAFDAIVQMGERGHIWDASKVKHAKKSKGRSTKKRKAVDAVSAPSDDDESREPGNEKARQVDGKKGRTVAQKIGDVSVPTTNIRRRSSRSARRIGGV